MSIWRKFFPGRSKRDEELEKELRAHLDLEAAELEESGTAPAEARYAAQRAFGSTALIKEDIRALSVRTWVEAFLQDVRYGLRQLRKSPGFATVAVMTLALGIGANTAIFSLVHAVLLKPLPVAHPEQLYNLGDDRECCSLTGSQDRFTLFSHPLYEEIRENTPEFSELAAFQSTLRNLTVRRSGDTGSGKVFRGECVSGNYFALFGVNAYAGRVLAWSDDVPGAPLVAVMSYRTWQVHFASDPGMIGSTVVIHRQPVTLIGIASPSFFGDTLRGDPADFWVPLSAEPVLDQVHNHLNKADDYWLYAIGRLRPEVPAEKTEAHVNSEIQHWVAARPNMSGYKPGEIEKIHVALTPASGGVANLRIDRAAALQFLMMVSVFVLLIA